MMLIKLPNSATNTGQVAELIANLKSGDYGSEICKKFFDINPRITREPQAVKMIVEYLEDIIKNPIELFVSFAQSPDEEFVVELTDWARVNIRKNILLNISIDPMLTGGMVIRTPQRIYDFSWNNSLNSRRDLLTKLVGNAS